MVNNLLSEKGCVIFVTDHEDAMEYQESGGLCFKSWTKCLSTRG